jgi:hypothetical protein
MSVCELNNHNTLDFIGQKLAQSNILYITHSLTHSLYNNLYKREK